MPDSDPLLLPLFRSLRRNGVPLGVDDYLLAVRMLREGRVLGGPDELRSLLGVLWAKSREDIDLLDEEFARLVRPRLAAPLPEPRDGPTRPSPPLPTPNASTVLPPPPRPRPVPATDPGAGPGRGSLPAMAARLPGSLPATEGPRATGAFQLTPRMPISRREMTAVWRHLRRPRRTGPPIDLDVEGTVQAVGRTGLFLRPSLVPRRRNQARLVILLDRSASMTPFGPLVDSLVDCIRRGGSLGQTVLYHFDNTPVGVLAEPGEVNRDRPLAAVMESEARGGSVLVLGDAGAARGAYLGSRVERTRAFLKTLAAATHLYAWVNPLPRERWRTTTAAGIARLVPMSSLTREGLIDAVNILRGHPFPPGVHLDAAP